MKNHKESCHHKDDNDTLPSDVRCRCICTCPEITMENNKDKKCQCYGPMTCQNCMPTAHQTIDDTAFSAMKGFVKDIGQKFPSPTKKGWEEEFDSLIYELVGQSDFSRYMGSFHCAKVKLFISQLLSSQKKEIRESIKGMKIDSRSTDDTILSHNDCIDTLLELPSLSLEDNE